MQAERRSWCRALGACVIGRTSNKNPNTIVKATWPTDSRAESITRAATSPTSRGNFPVHNIVGAFRSLAPSSAALRLFEQSLTLDMAGINQISLPLVEGLPVQAVFVGENMPAPAAMWSFSSVVCGPMRKILLLSAVSGELQASVPETASAIIGKILAASAGRGIDAAAFSNFAGDLVTPPGLLANVVPLAAAPAGYTALADDLGALATAIGASNIDPSGIVYVAGPREATMIKVLAGSAMFTNQVLVTLALPPKSIAAFSLAAITSGWDAMPTIETSRESVIHFESASPADIVAGGVASSPTRSQFQTDVISVRVKANAAWCCVPGGAQLIENVAW